MIQSKYFQSSKNISRFGPPPASKAAIGTLKKIPIKDFKNDE
jgi:hypothetical protein